MSNRIFTSNRPKADEPYRPKYLFQQGSIMSCCGAAALSNFPTIHTYYKYNQKTGREVMVSCFSESKSDDQVREEVEKDLVHYLQNPYSCIFVTLNEKQQRSWHDLLTKYDFKIINDAFHTYSYLNIITYVRNRYVPAAKEGYFKDTALSKKDRDKVPDLLSHGGKKNIDAWEAENKKINEAAST